MLTNTMCETMLTAAREKSQQMGVSVSIAIADAAGYLLAFSRVQGTILPSIRISIQKAYTAALMKLSTREVGNLAQPGADAYGIETLCPDLVIFGGGFPLFHDGVIVGGIGVSGGTSHEDEEIAQAAIAVFEQQTV